MLWWPLGWYLLTASLPLRSVGCRPVFYPMYGWHTLLWGCTAGTGPLGFSTAACKKMYIRITDMLPKALLGSALSKQIQCLTSVDTCIFGDTISVLLTNNKDSEGLIDFPSITWAMGFSSRFKHLYLNTFTHKYIDVSCELKLPFQPMEITVWFSCLNVEVQCHLKHPRVSAWTWQTWHRAYGTQHAYTLLTR